MTPERRPGSMLLQNGRNLEILLSLSDATYQMVIEHSYRGVFNPSLDHFQDLISGRVRPELGLRKLLFGITFNGVCPADCLNCPFAQSVMSPQHVRARPITAEELIPALDHAAHTALSRGLLAINEPFSAGALLAGDPSYSHEVPALMAAVSRFPNCVSSRWSTIAARISGHNVLTAFAEGAQAAKPGHRINTQVSLHSTDDVERKRHTGVENLIPMAEIAAKSWEIFAITKRRLSLAFVVHAGSVIEPKVLKKYFSPNANVVSLRPMFSSTTEPMDHPRLVELYSALRRDSWDVVYMPPNFGDDDAGVPAELLNLRATTQGL